MPSTLHEPTILDPSKLNVDDFDGRPGGVIHVPITCFDYRGDGIMTYCGHYVADINLSEQLVVLTTEPNEVNCEDCKDMLAITTDHHIIEKMK